MSTSIANMAAAPAEFERRVHKALKHWTQGRPEEGLLDDLILSQQMASKNPLLTRRQITNAVLEQGLASLRAEDHEAAELLRLRFCHNQALNEIKTAVNYAESTLFAKQSRAIAELARILHNGEIAARSVRAGHVTERIDAVWACRPLGIDQQVATLVDLLARRDAPYIISIEGIGGIGKTTLAAAVMRAISQTAAFDDFGWLSAQPAALDGMGGIRTRPQPALTAGALVSGLLLQLAPGSSAALPASPERALHTLRERLRRIPHLIVIDNLETVLDLQRLLPVLQTLANPSKFILTSRLRLCSESGIYLHPVPAMNEQTALQLVRQAARYHGLSELAAAPDAELHPIYAAVGGNPLALLLVVGQAQVRPLQAVLADLSCSCLHDRSQAWETMFAYIYRQAWDGLQCVDRRVLLAICGAQVTDLDAEALATICSLDVAATTASLQRLIQANLVFMEGSLSTGRYRVHCLTYRFLQGLAAQWLASDQH